MGGISLVWSRVGIGPKEIETCTCMSQTVRRHLIVDSTIATWQSLLQPKRLAKFNPASHKLIIADEAHHNAAPSYMDILHHFNAHVTRNLVKT